MIEDVGGIALFGRAGFYFEVMNDQFFFGQPLKTPVGRMTGRLMQVGVEIIYTRELFAHRPQLQEDVLHDVFGDFVRAGNLIYIAVEPSLVGVKKLSEGVFTAFGYLQQQRRFVIW